MTDQGEGGGFSTRAIHAGDLPPGIAEQPVSPPVWLTADYLYEGLDHYAEVIGGRRPGYVYGRHGGPTHLALHRVLASLEGAEDAWSFASGMAALHAALAVLVRAGDHVVAQRTIYGGTWALLTTTFAAFGVETTFVEPEAEAVAAALRPSTRAVLLETVANPTFRVADVGGVAAVCADRRVALVVDNTVATPYLLRPLSLPARPAETLVVHSTTKYVGGHSDVIGGAVAGDAGPIERVRRAAIELGSTAGAFDAWLALRGAQTMALRLDRQCGTAAMVAAFLEGHPRVERVGYSGLDSHPDHGRASALFDGPRYGAILSFDVRGGYEAASRACGVLRVVRVGSSFGGLHSEICHPATTSHRQMPPAERAAAGIGDGLLRLAVGGEDPADLLADLERALEGA